MQERIKVEGGKVYIDGELRLEATPEFLSGVGWGAAVMTTPTPQGRQNPTLTGNLFRYETDHEDAFMAGMFLSRLGLTRDADGVWRQRRQAIGNA